MDIPPCASRWWYSQSASRSGGRWIRFLAAAIAADKDARASEPDDPDDEEGERRISLANRAFPLLELLDAASEACAPVMWE